MPLKIELKDQKERTLLALRGGLDIDGSRELLSTGQLLTAPEQHREILLDLSGISSHDSAGIAALAQVVGWARDADIKIRATGIPDDLAGELAVVPIPTARTSSAPRDGASTSSQWLEGLGHFASAIAEEIVSFLQLMADSLYWVFVAPFKRRPLPLRLAVAQMVNIGADAVPVVSLISFLLGLIMAFQASYQLRQFGANIFVANLVGIAMVKEFGPLATAIVLAGRSGSAIAAELGTMIVGEEVDALRTMGIDPIRFLVVPRFLAITATQPALTAIAMAVGVFGGFLIAVFYLDLSATSYIEQTVHALKLTDVFEGLEKSLLFAWVIVFVACHYGLRIRGGAVGVGRSTTGAVVAGIFGIILVDSIFTTLSTLLGR